MQKLAFYDTECFPNFWLLKLRPLGEESLSFSIRAGQRLSDQQMAEIRALFQTYTVISFNGINYDVAMITGALSGYTPEQLKVINDRMIVEKVRHWELGLPRWQPADHIDLIEVLPGTGSAKMYAARGHSKTVQDLPYDPDRVLTELEMQKVTDYCENDLDNLEDRWNDMQPQIEQRIVLSEKYSVDLRSKSDAQIAEVTLKLQCERAKGVKLDKPIIDYNMSFRYDVPAFIGYELPQLKDTLEKVRSSVFRLGASGKVDMPPQLDELAIPIGQSVYRLGIGGLHSSENNIAHVSDDDTILEDADVVSYYPRLILNSGKFPIALGPQFASEFGGIVDFRITNKKRAAELREREQTAQVMEELRMLKVNDEGGKAQIVGTFGKTGSNYSILFAPEMLIQTTLTGQLSLLMLIEWLEYYGMSVISANTDGIVIKCKKSLISVKDHVIIEWEKRTGLKMEFAEYKAIYFRDVNTYFAIKADRSVKRKGEYAKASIVGKKNPDVEICSDAVADFLSKGTPLLYSLAACRDIRKFVAIQKVTGGGIKLWGDGPRKNTLVREIVPILLANGWIKQKRVIQLDPSKTQYEATYLWVKGDYRVDTRTAYALCFPVQRPEYLGKVVRWYYSTQAPGPIVYAKRNAIVGLSYGAKPCMTLPDDFPTDIDYDWYMRKCLTIINDIGYSDGTVNKE